MGCASTKNSPDKIKKLLSATMSESPPREIQAILMSKLFKSNIRSLSNLKAVSEVSPHLEVDQEAD